MENSWVFTKKYGGDPLGSMTNFKSVFLGANSRCFFGASFRLLGRGSIALAADPQKGEGTPGGAKANLSNLSDEKVRSKSPNH